MIFIGLAVVGELVTSRDGRTRDTGVALAAQLRRGPRSRHETRPSQDF